MTSWPMGRLRSLRELLLTFLVFIVVLTGYVTSHNITSFDSVWSVHTAMSLLREGNTNLDEYRDLIDHLTIRHATEIIDSHLFNVYPVGTSILAAPFLAILDLVARQRWGFGLESYIQLTVPEPLEMLIASIITALAAIVIYRLARLSLPPIASLVLTFIFAFCTSAWSTASRALWQHGPSILMLALALYLLLLARHRPRLAQFVSIPLAFSYVIRPTNSLSIALLTLYVVFEYRQYFIRYLFWAMWIAIPFVLLNQSIYHSILPNYYSWYKEFSVSTLFEALIGNLFSPSRGLLIFSPVFIFSAVGIVLKVKGRSWTKLDTSLIGIIVLHWIAISIWPVWWAGWSFGPRIFSDMIPYFIYFLIPVFDTLSRLATRTHAIAGLGILGTIVVSFFIHYRGANAQAVLRWNTQPLDVDQYPGRAWDWQDIQFLRGLKWGTPADVSISGLPVEQLARSTYFRLGTNDFHLREFDASTTLIAPVQPAWQIISRDQSIDNHLTHLFDGTAPQATATTVADQQLYDLYYFDLGTRLLAEAQHSQQTAAWSGTANSDLSNLQPISLPVHFSNTLDLLGFQIITDTNANDLSILTYWQIRERTDRRLQLFVHVVGSDNQILAQHDEFGVLPADWFSGDVVLQVTHLNLPTDHLMREWIEIGWYDNDSTLRLPVIVDHKTISDRLLIGQIFH